jgi:aminoglycoside phosphotransferase (APT) family kinase protein
LAQVHAIPAPEDDVVDKGEVTGDKNHLWEYLLWSCRSLYSPDETIPDERLANLIPRMKQWLEEQQETLHVPAVKYLLHKDVGVGNIITRGDEVFLIDWEDREFGDPMSDFPTGFWDIEAAGRIILSSEERQALYSG